MLEELQNKLEEAKERAERRRDELLRALEREEVADPITATVFGSVILAKILGAVAISAAISAATYGITRALTPKQRFTTGQLQGTLQIPQSDQGLPIAECYGADPGSNATPFQPSHDYALEDRVVKDGFFYIVTTSGTSAATAPTFPATKGATVTSGSVTFTCYGRTGGGARLPMLVVWTSGLRKHENPVEGGGGGKGPEQPEQTEITYDLDLAIMPGRGPLRVKRIRANMETIYRAYGGGQAYYEAEAATKTGGAANVSDPLASGGVAVTVPQNGAVEWAAVGGDGTPAVLEFYLKTSAPVTVEMTWTGGAGTTVFQANISSTGGVYNLEYGSAPWLLHSGSGNSVKIKNLSADPVVLDRLGVRLSGGATGVPDSGVDPDDDYDPLLPPTPNEPYDRPMIRFAGELEIDPEGVMTGNVQAGSYAPIAIYPGNDEQLPDPTMQAAIDALYGPDSTPAFRGRCLVVLTSFYLTSYGGAIPLIQTLAEHQTLDTYEAIFGHWCDRVGVLDSTDYDFSSLRRKFCRGFPVTPPYAPADVMEELARVENVYFVESDKIYAYERNSQAPVATLSSSDLGWVDGDADEEEGELASLDFDLATETEIARRYEFTFVDPERDYEQNSQGTSRQVTSSERTEKIELALTKFPEEAREITQRELYEEHVESTKHRLDLDWSYLWLTPGDSIIVEEDDGTTSRIFIESFRPNVGVCPAEGSAEETAVYSQPVSTSGGGVFEVPPVPIPGMTLLGIYDGPAVRTEDEGRSGFITWAYKRVGDGRFTSATLVKVVEGEPQPIATFTTQATAGLAVTALGGWSDIETEDGARAFTADAGANALSSTDHELENDETVMVSNAGGALPGGLSAATLYYVVNRTANTLKLALTSGGSAVDITSAGTGTHSVQRVIEIDLHDRAMVLESVTPDQIANGANPALYGNEVIQTRTWELVAGYDRRWRGRNFTRGLRGTEPLTGSHVAGERFVLLNSAIQFVPQDIGELNIEREFKAVTAGQSLDDAASVFFPWTGGTLKFPAPSVQASHDADNTWRGRLYGVETNDPAGERYSFEVVDGRSFNPRGAASRPVSLSLTSATADDMPPPPGKGSSQFRDATVPGNSVSNSSAFVVQLITGERTALSATYHTTLTDSDSPVSNETFLVFSPGMTFSLTLLIKAQTSTDAATLEIWDSLNVSPLWDDTAGEATGTRYTAEFIDGKVKFYRNRGVHSEPFYTYAVPADVELFPCEAQVSAGTDCSLEAIEIDDEGAAVIYTEAEQIEDFGSAQPSITVRACQQRVVQGVVVDGQVVEVTFP